MSRFHRINSLQDYKNTYQKSIENPEAFWDEIAKTFTWKKPYTKVLDWNFKEPHIQWFADGQLNITENCLDRHLETKVNQNALERLSFLFPNQLNSNQK